MTMHEPATRPTSTPTVTGYQPYPSYASYPASSYVPYAPVSQTQAVWALVLAIVPIPVGWLVSIGLSISVISQSRDGRGRERGKGMAVAALVIAPLWILAVIALVVAGGDLETTAERNPAGNVTAAGDARVDALRVGDCLARTPETGATRTVALVPCSQKHAGEVFASFDLAAGAYPGQAEVRRLSEGGCLRRFDRGSISATPGAKQGLFFYVPTEGQWSGSRAVTCIVVDGAAGSEAGTGV